MAVGLLLGATWRSFEAEAFELSPVFEGPLEEAPRIVDTVLAHVEGLEDISDRFDILSGHIAELYATNLGLEEGRPADETRILHVSDIHLNPIGLEITRQLAQEFRPHAVLDTGDLTSFGQPFEAAIVPLVESVGVAYLYVPGNHDSEANRTALGAASNVTLLDGTVAEVGPVRILGVADPTFTATGEMSHDEANAVLDAAATRLRPLVVQQRPHLLAVHNTRMAKASLGRVPYVVAGHIHRTTSEDRQGTLVLTVGSTGSTGLGEFTQTEDPRYEAEILRFSGTTLVAVDRLMLEGRRGSFQISREVIGRPPLTPEPLTGRFR
jgi:predicted phosphodiesterase